MSDKRFLNGQVLEVRHQGMEGEEIVRVEVTQSYQDDNQVWQHVLTRVDTRQDFCRATVDEIQAVQVGFGD